MDRSVAAVGATSGSLSAWLFRLLSEGLPSHPDCSLGDLLASPVWDRVDILSLCLGILLGLLLGPWLDLCFLARQAWRAWIRASLSYLAEKHKSETLYRFA